MKRLFVSLLLAAALLVSTVASASVDLASMTDDELHTLVEDVYAELGRRSENASNRIGAYSVEIMDAELMKDDNGGDCLVVTFEWSHEKDEPQTFFWSFNYYAFQDGIQIETPNVYIFMPLDTQDTRIKAGAVLKTQIAFALRNTSSPVEIEISEYLGDTGAKVEKTFDLIALGGSEAPEQPKVENGGQVGVTVIGKPKR